MTTTSGSPEELPVVGVPPPNGSSGSVELGFELIVFPISLMHYQLTIQQSLGQRFLINFLRFFTKEYGCFFVAPAKFVFVFEAALTP